MTGSKASRLRSAVAVALPWVTGVWVLIELLSLRLGLLNRIFFDTLHADVQGIDYYSLPKAWLNLASGRSAYATFDPPAYGPHFTWYLAHPVLSVVLGWPLSRLEPTDSYGLFTILSMAVMGISAWVLARESDDVFVRRMIWLLLLGAFPTFEMLFVGNVQSLTVLGLALLFGGMLQVVKQRQHASGLILAGLLVSLFTKPVVLLMFPLLLLLGETRRAALQAIAVYVPVSLIFETVPALNPEPIGLDRVMWLALHPGFVRRTMDIYQNHLALTPDMRDNSIHWFNLIAQSGFRLKHIDVFSLPVFLDTAFGVRTPSWIYVLPTIVVLALSVMVGRIRDEQVRREDALLIVLAASLSFFLSYTTVWEYQYTAVLPVGAVLLLVGSSKVAGPTMRRWMLGLVVLIWLPSLYFLSGSADPSASVATMVRLDRVVPVTILFVLLVIAATRAAVSGQRPSPSVAPPRRDCSSPVGSRA